MGDYNIYIRSSGGSGQTNPTKPWSVDDSNDSVSPTTSWGEMTQYAVQGINLGANPAQLAAFGTTNVAKEKAKIAAAFAAVMISKKLVAKALTFVGETQARQQGDFSISHSLNNLNRLYSNITNPFNLTINMAVEEDNRRIENERRYLQRGLLGETQANRGV